MRRARICGKEVPAGIGGPWQVAMMGEKLKDKVAIVTGAGRGIGREIAIAMAEEGAKVVVNDLGGSTDGTGSSASPADEVVEEIKKLGGSAVASYESVTTPEGGEGIVKTAIDTFGRIDILVNNAGVLRDRMIWNMTDDEWDVVMKVHLYGHFHCTRPASAKMREQRWGRLINMTSASGLLGNPGQANYSAAKAGIVGFTRSCALALGRYGVTSNAISPSGSTRLMRTMPLDRARELAKKRGFVPKGVDIEAVSEDELFDMIFGSPADVAPLAVHLASEEASEINGQVFGVFGGRIGMYAPMTEMKSIFKQGRWTQEELSLVFPQTLAAQLINPAPPEPPK